MLDEVEKVCSDVLVLEKGKQIYFGKVTALTTDHGYFELSATDNTALKAFLESKETIEQLEEKNGLLLAYPNQAITIEELSTLLIKEGIVVTHLVQKHKSLEEQFLTLTKEKP